MGFMVRSSYPTGNCRRNPVDAPGWEEGATMVGRRFRGQWEGTWVILTILLEKWLAKSACKRNAGKAAAVRLRAEMVMPVKWIAERLHMGAPGYNQSPVIPAARGGIAISKTPFCGKPADRWHPAREAGDCRAEVEIEPRLAVGGGLEQEPVEVSFFGVLSGGSINTGPR